MVVDATVPSLVLLVVVVAAVLGIHLGGAVLTHVRRVVRAAADRPALLVSERWCPRVVLIDDDGWTPVAV